MRCLRVPIISVRKLNPRGTVTPRPRQNVGKATEWQETVMDWLRYQRDIELEIKEIRKKAFERAEQKWWDCREEIQQLEDEQEAAGVGEVVALEERAGGAGGAGRRR